LKSEVFVCEGIACKLWLRIFADFTNHPEVISQFSIKWF